MGIYIDWPDKLKIGKAARLKNDHGAVDFAGTTFADIPEGKVLVYVAENREGGPGVNFMGSDGRVVEASQPDNFDAAGIVTDVERFEEMTDPADPRTIHKLLLDRDEAIKLAPAIQSLGL